MEELINQLKSKINVDSEQARTAVQTVLAFLKDKLPAPLASQVEKYLSEGGDGGGDLGDKLKGMFGS